MSSAVGLPVSHNLYGRGKIVAVESKGGSNFYTIRFLSQDGNVVMNSSEFRLD
jgi:hypothetical protein